MDDKAILAQQAVNKCGILECLRDYSATVVSTIWVGLDIEDSDIDIVCTYETPVPFIQKVIDSFAGYPSYRLHQNEERVLVQFSQDEFLIEVYACQTPVEKQVAYRHFKVMERLVKCGGDRFRVSVRRLKEKGLKTEPAIASLLKLEGNPYKAVLDLYNFSDLQLSKLFNKK